MKGRETKAAPSADLLVCFPSRAHLTLMQKPICSPARTSERIKRPQHAHHHQHRMKKSSNRGGGSQASPLLWAKNKQTGAEIAEPTSPKVTCAGQIKVRHKGSSCKSWQSVMEEIERIHNKGKQKQRSTWTESLGFKKEVMQFLTCLKNIRFDFHCFGSFSRPDVTSDDDDGEYQEFEENNDGAQGSDGNEASRTVFSKWFMVLQENQANGLHREEVKEKERFRDEEHSLPPHSVPPPNALLLMRCRSAPAKSWLEEKLEAEKEKYNDDDDDEEEEGDNGDNTDTEEENRKREAKRGKNLKTLIEEEKRNSQKENLVAMKSEADFYKIPTDIAKETWVVGGIRHPLSRSQSWKR